MKLDRAIIACDGATALLDFWSLAASSWKTIDVTPTLVLVEKHDEDLVVDETLGEVIRLKLPDDEIHSAFAAQAVRLLAPCLYPDENITLADIDIMPLNKNYFSENIKTRDDNSFIQLRYGVVARDEIAMCWNVAKGRVWADIFDLWDIDFNNYEDRFIEILRAWHPEGYNGRSPRGLWGTDQKLLFRYVKRWEEDNNRSRHVKLRDSDTGFNRLDHRIRMVKRMGDKFTDFCPRRPPQHKLGYRGRPNLDNIDCIKVVFDWYKIPWIYKRT
tara:strand:+ start:133 stop:948 length:816 start_codon:yes stop_codon:yes gene_type:complete